MMASLLQTNTASTSGSGSLPSNTIANPKGELKAITTRSGLVIDGPTVPTPPTSINPEVDERVEETFTDPDLTEYTIKVPPPPVPKYKPPSQREFVIHQRDPLYPNIPYPSRMLKQKQQEKDEVQIQKFWQMFKKLHVNVTLADALILMPKYQKMLKALLSNKEKLQKLANTPLNENCSAVILKKLPEKLGDPGKFLIPGLFTDGPTVPNPPKPGNPEEDECVEETYKDPDHAEYNIKVPPPPPVQKPKPLIQRIFFAYYGLSSTAYPVSLQNAKSKTARER
nr:reverse transcriptase domain-containing protein [Tanacetum cinerariifolium]